MTVTLISDSKSVLVTFWVPWARLSSDSMYAVTAGNWVWVWTPRDQSLERWPIDLAKLLMAIQWTRILDNLITTRQNMLAWATKALEIIALRVIWSILSCSKQARPSKTLMLHHDALVIRTILRIIKWLKTLGISIRRSIDHRPLTSLFYKLNILEKPKLLSLSTSASAYQ